MSLTENKEVDFTLINKLTVSIESHKVALGKCEDMEEMDNICKNIVEMEAEILAERKKEVKYLYQQKEDILQKISTLESSLDEVNRNINVRVSRYRDAVTTRISRLETEVNGKKSEMVPKETGVIESKEQTEMVHPTIE